MIVLDTNVLSEPLEPRPDARVIAWLRLGAEPSGTTAVNIGELLTGIQRLPAGRRKDEIAAGVERLIDAYVARILPYDEAAARIYADLQAQRRGAGRPLTTEDGMIAATCLARGARLATRNTDDFTGLGVDLVDPWAHET